MNNRATRRATIAKGRRDRVQAFRDQAGAGGFETSLRAVGEHRPQDARAISNWFFAQPTATCFCCRSSVRKPGAFLTVTASRAPGAGIAVSAICLGCWNDKTPEEIERAALELLRRNLGARGFAD
jgi:hypothetical protein